MFRLHFIFYWIAVEISWVKTRFGGCHTTFSLYWKKSVSKVLNKRRFLLMNWLSCAHSFIKPKQVLVTAGKDCLSSSCLPDPLLHIPMMIYCRRSGLIMNLSASSTTHTKMLKESLISAKIGHNSRRGFPISESDNFHLLSSSCTIRNLWCNCSVLGKQ